jgi:hypothetical protein
VDLKTDLNLNGYTGSTIQGPKLKLLKVAVVLSYKETHPIGKITFEFGLCHSIEN